MPGAHLLERASDWINQSYFERLLAAAAVLRVHGYLPEGEFGRISDQVRDDVDAVRANVAKERAA